MANEEHLAILRQGVEVWNAWRWENFSTAPDLATANLSKMDLSRANLSRADLQDANLNAARLQGTNFQGANINRADLRNADLTSARVIRTHCIGADFRSATLRSARFIQSNLSKTKFNNAELAGADLSEVRLSEANLRQVNLSGINLGHAKINDADLRATNLSGARLVHVDFSRSVLHGADLSRADLTGATLHDTQLTGVTSLKRANLTFADLTGASFDRVVGGGTTFAGLDLSVAQGLDSLYHSDPSFLTIDTLYRSQGHIPEVFWRGCGVPDSMIEYARALVVAQRPIDYYSVFISYSSQNEAIAQRLHADLQAAGVRCWFAPHDLEIGAPIAGGIDEAIRVYDKLLIILSESSIKSNWVGFEVSQALHREIEQGRTLLFPIRLDDAVLSTPSGWAVQLRSRHIGDFRGWKDHDRYQAAFARLLRDLKAKDQAGT